MNVLSYLLIPLCLFGHKPSLNNITKELLDTFISSEKYKEECFVSLEVRNDSCGNALYITMGDASFLPKNYHREEGFAGEYRGLPIFCIGFNPFFWSGNGGREMILDNSIEEWTCDWPIWKIALYADNTLNEFFTTKYHFYPYDDISDIIELFQQHGLAPKDSSWALDYIFGAHASPPYYLFDAFSFVDTDIVMSYILLQLGNIPESNLLLKDATRGIDVLVVVQPDGSLRYEGIRSGQDLTKEQYEAFCDIGKKVCSLYTMHPIIHRGLAIHYRFSFPIYPKSLLRDYIYDYKQSKTI